MLFCAAELTLKSGYNFFVFASDRTDASKRYLPSFECFYGGWGPYYWGPRSAFGGGFGASTSTPITEYVAQANVVIFKGKKPDTDVHAFDAREVRTNRSEEHTSELQSLMRISYAVFCLKKKNRTKKINELK